MLVQQQNIRNRIAQRQKKRSIRKIFDRYGPITVLGALFYGGYKLVTGPTVDAFAGTYAPEFNPDEYPPIIPIQTPILGDITKSEEQDYNKLNNNIKNKNITNIDMPSKQSSYVSSKRSYSKYNRKNYSKKKQIKKRTYKKKQYGKRKQYYSKPYLTYAMKKYIKNVATSKIDNQAVGTWRDIDSGQISCEENQCAYSSQVFLDVNQIENAIDDMKVINVSTGNASATDMDPTTQDGLKTKIINAYSEINIRNNGKTPCYLEVRWLFTRRRTTATATPSSIFEDGLENKLITANETTDLRFNVWDSPEYNRFFKTYKYRKYYMLPSQELMLKICRKKPYLYDPDHFDQHSASDGQPGLTQWLHFRIRGVVAHDDTTTNLVGTCDATLDYIRTTHIKFSSVMGQGFKYCVTGASTLDTMTAGSVVNIPSTDETGEQL